MKLEIEMKVINANPKKTDKELINELGISQASLCRIRKKYNFKKIAVFKNKISEWDLMSLESKLWFMDCYDDYSIKDLAFNLDTSQHLIRIWMTQLKLTKNHKLKWMTSPHPLGMKGKKHSEEMRAKTSKRVIAAWKDPNSVYNSHDFKQRQSDQMSKRQRMGTLRNGYSRGAMGKRKDLNNKFFRSSWEANYARYLNLLISKGQIHKWEFEPDTFLFEEIKRGTRSYCPDFKIWETPKSLPYYIEVKGWMDAKSQTKLKRMAKYYPNTKIILVQKKEYKELEQWKALIPNWE